MGILLVVNHYYAGAFTTKRTELTDFLQIGNMPFKEKIISQILHMRNCKEHTIRWQ